MSLKTFKGGIHPNYQKHLSSNTSILEMKASKEVVFPLSQHIGAPCTPIIEIGDEVRVGQMIGQKGGFVSANIFSSVSGKVTKIEDRLTVSGRKIKSIVIENDGEYSLEKGINVYHDYNEYSNEEIKELIDWSGIVGLGGAGFPTSVKLAVKDPTTIDYILINGAECEPYLTSDHVLMKEQYQSIVRGIKIVLKLFPNAKAIIGIENNKLDAAALIEKEIINDDRISIQLLKTKYPQGGERSLIYATTKRKLNSKKLPADVGCIVDNVQTFKAIDDAVSYHIPLYSKVITVTGEAIHSPCNIRVPFGTNYKDILEVAGGYKEKPAKLISGGPMMGQAIYTLDFPAQKTSSALLALSEDQVSTQRETNCIHCGKCVSVCPSRIVPTMMYDACLNKDLETFKKINGMECMECGSCTFICPAKRPMTQAFKLARIMVRKESK